MNCVPCLVSKGSVWHGAYRSNCDECTARAIARSTAAARAFDARYDGNHETLDRLVALALPGVSKDIAHRMVRTWWDRDQQIPHNFPSKCSG